MKKITKTGIINVNGTNIQYTLTDNYFDSEKLPIAHCEFLSLTIGRKNIVSDTGFLSHFFGLSNIDFSKLIESDHKTIIESLVYRLAEENGLKIRSLSFAQLPEMADIRAKQQTLF